MEFLIISGIILVLGFYFTNKSNTQKHKSKTSTLIKNQEQINDYLRNNELNESNKYISNDYSNGIVFNEKTGELLIITKKFKKNDGTFSYSFKHYTSNNLMESEVIIDNQSVYKTVRSNQLLGATVGGALLGGIGAILGGLSANKSKEDNIKSIQMKLSIDDLDSPSYKINFLSNVDSYTGEINKKGYSKDSSQVKAALSHVERWQGIMDIIIKQQNKAISS